MTREQKPYRQCVGICLFNKSGQVFVGERIDTPGAWQMPQGGIDKNENIETAAYRELYEETGINKATIIKIGPTKTRYDLPGHLENKLWKGKFRGQEQTWIAMRFTGDDTDIKINHHPAPEFSSWQWTNLENTLNLIVPFKRDVYKNILKMFSDIQ